MNNFLETFANEIAQVKDSELKGHIINIIGQCPSYVLSIPSSSTGKYHPPDEVGVPDGMTIHIKRLCMLAPEIVRKNKDIDNKGTVYPELNYLIAGALLHDIFKNGDPPGKWTSKEHPSLIYKKIHKYIEENNLSGTPVGVKLVTVANVCLFHEGRWTVEKSKEAFQQLGNGKMSESDKLLCRDMHEIDYWASRRVLFDIMQIGFGKSNSGEVE